MDGRKMISKILKKVKETFLRPAYKLDHNNNPVFTLNADGQKVYELDENNKGEAAVGIEPVLTFLDG